MKILEEPGMARIARRSFLSAPAVLLATGAAAQEWPTRPIRIVVGFPAGVATDVVIRLLSARMTERRGWQFVVDNRPGQGGSLGAAHAAQQAPDGYTLLMTATAPLATNPNLYANVGYDSARDFAPITLIANLPFVLATRPDLPPTTIQEFIAYMRERPGQLNFGSSGNGTTSHLIAMMFARAAGGLQFTHIPYRGSPAAFTDLSGGRLDFMFDTEVFLLPHIQGGRAKALAVSTARRTLRQPDVPTLAESGMPGFDAAAWLGLVAPAGTPAPIVERLNRELHEVMAEPEIAARMGQLGAQVLTSTPAEFGDFIRSELQKWGSAVRDNNVRLD